MAEEFLTLMADLDDDSQQTLSGWYEDIKKAGFTGTQTPGLPFHISMGCFSLDKESDVIDEMKELTTRFSSFPVHISHIGLFAGGKVLYAAPDMNPSDLLGKQRKEIWMQYLNCTCICMRIAYRKQICILNKLGSRLSAIQITI